MCSCELLALADHINMPHKTDHVLKKTCQILLVDTYAVFTLEHCTSAACDHKLANGPGLHLNRDCASVRNCLSRFTTTLSPEVRMNVCQAHNKRKHPFGEKTGMRGKLEKERDIKGQVFSIQEGDRGSRSDKLFCKQPPQILPAGGSPSTCCFVYQSALKVLRGHWSNDPYLSTPPPYTESQYKSDYLLPLPPVLPPPLPLFFPPAHSVFFFMCFKGLTLKNFLFCLLLLLLLHHPSNSFLGNIFLLNKGILVLSFAWHVLQPLQEFILP